MPDRWPRNMQAALYFNRKRRRGRINTITSPVVADQSIDFGALTAAGAGGVAPTNTGGAITSATIDSGDASSHWQIASDGTITPTAAGDTANLSGGPYSLVCTFEGTEGSDTATITVNTSGNDSNGYNLANVYSVATIAELETVLEISGLTYGTNHILLRGEVFNPTADGSDAIISPAAYTGTKTAPTALSPAHKGVDVATGTYINVAPHAGASPKIRRMQLNAATSAQGGIRFTGIAFEWQPVTSPGDPKTFSMIRFALDDILIDNCTFKSTVTTTDDVPVSCIITDAGRTNCYIQDNTANDFDHFVVNSHEYTNIQIIGNTCRSGWSDQIFFNSGGQTIKINWNRITDKKHKSGGSHPDFIQIAANSATDNLTGVEFIGNQLYRGDGFTGRNDGQGIFIKDIPRRIAFDAQTGNFTVGLTITGGTSGATARITSQTDNGATGFLNLADITGTFVDNETITDTSTGSATTDLATLDQDIRVVSPEIAGNFVNISLTNGISVEDADTADIHHNTVLLDLDAFIAPTTQCGIFLSGASSDAGTISDNITNVISVGSDITSHTETNNSTIAVNQTAYDAVFDDPTFGSSLTDPEVNYAVTSSTTQDTNDIGIYQDGLVDFDNRTTNFTATPPSIATSALSFDSTADLSHDVTMPTGYAENDLVIVFMSAERIDGAGFATPSGWAELASVDSAGSVTDGCHIKVIYKVLGASEPATLTVSSSTSRMAAQAWRIGTGTFTGTPEIATAVGNSTSPNPPSLSPSWGNDGVLWIACSGSSASNTRTSIPAGYSGELSQTSNDFDGTPNTNIQQSRAWSCSKQATASTEDPAAFVLDASSRWVAATIAVRGA